MKVKKLPASCAVAKDIRITQRVLDASATPYASVGYRVTLCSQSVIDGKHVAVVAVSNNAMNEAGESPSPHLMCACDFYYTTLKQSRCHMDTFSCARKKVMRTERRRELRDEYHAKGTPAEDVFLDLFARVSRGEWVGQGRGDCLYLQEAAEIAGVDKGLALAGWKIGQKLVEQKKIGLDGAIMISYVEPTPDIPNEARTPLGGSGEVTDNPHPVWSTTLDNRFYCEVQRVNADTHKGVLCVFDKNAQNKLIAFSEVTLSYGVQFGPDVGDTMYWQDSIGWFVDSTIHKPAILLEAPASAIVFTVVSAST